MSGLDVVTFGEAMVLHLAEPGVPLAAATSLRRSIAGSELNVAVGLARLGVRTGWFGLLGDDVHGRLIRGVLRAEGVDTTRVRLVPDGWTGLLVRDAHAERPVTVVYHRAGSSASTLTPDDVDPDYLGGAGTLFLSGITAVLSESARTASARAVELAAERGLTVVLDPNVRRRLGPVERTAEVLRPLAAAAHVVLAGLDEAELITGEREPVAAARLVPAALGPARRAQGRRSRLVGDRRCADVGAARRARPRGRSGGGGRRLHRRVPRGHDARR